MAHARQQQRQMGQWLQRFDLNKTGRLERDELGELLTFLHPEVGNPSREALDLLITQATEIRTYTMHVKGDPNGSVGAGELMAVVSGYAMYLLASAAFDRRQCEGVVALRDLPALMKEANAGHACEHGDVDFVVDCCNSSLNGSVSGMGTSVISREELLPAFAAWTKALSEAASVDGGGSDGEDESGSASGAGEEEVMPLDGQLLEDFPEEEGEDEPSEPSEPVGAVSTQLAALGARGEEGADARRQGVPGYAATAAPAVATGAKGGKAPQVALHRRADVLAATPLTRQDSAVCTIS